MPRDARRRARTAAGSARRTRAGCATRATTLPSSSAATAFTDDVPISMPTVTLAACSGLRSRQRREHGVVHETVRAHEAARRSRRSRPSSVAPPSAGFFDDRDERGDVPERHDRVDRDVERAFGDEHVLPEVADTARAPAAVRRGRAVLSPMPSVVEPLLRVPRERQLRVGDRATTGDDRDRASPSRNAPSPRPAHQRMSSAGADATPTTSSPACSSADQRRPDRHAAHVALRAVDRVDDPAELGVGRAAPGSSPNSSPSTACPVVRREPLADRALDRLVGLAHRREVGLGRDLADRRRETAPS